MKRRNNEIELLRFIFSLTIMFHHSNLMFSGTDKIEHVLAGGGNRAVEFFFLISGYLTASTCISNKLHSTEAYMWHRIKPLLLPLWISWIVSFAGYHLIKVHTDLVTTAKDALASIFELLFLQNAGFTGKYYVGVSWYMSALLISILIVSVPLNKYKKGYIFWAAPVIAITVLGFLSHEYGTIVNVHKWVGIAYKCQFRAFAEINLGIFIYGLCQYFKKINFTVLGTFLLSCMEIGGYGIVIFYMWCKNNNFKYDFAILIILAVCILITFSEKSFLHAVCGKDHFILEFLGKYSLYIYLNQKVFCNIIPIMFENKSYWELIFLYTAAVLLTALLVMKTVELVRNHVFPIIRHLIIEQ